MCSPGDFGRGPRGSQSRVPPRGIPTPVTTPTTRCGAPLITTIRPTIPRSPPKRSRQSFASRTTGGAAPARSSPKSAARSVRPSSAATPSVSKNSAETSPASTAVASTPVPSVTTAARWPARASIDGLSARNVRSSSAERPVRPICAAGARFQTRTTRSCPVAATRVRAACVTPSTVPPTPRASPSDSTAAAVAAGVAPSSRAASTVLASSARGVRLRPSTHAACQ